MPKYQTLLFDKVLGDKLEGRNAKPILFLNQAQCVACIIALDDFYMSKWKNLLRKALFLVKWRQKIVH